jgi:hypothetical protein
MNTRTYLHTHIHKNTHHLNPYTHTFPGVIGTVIAGTPDSGRSYSGFFYGGQAFSGDVRNFKAPSPTALPVTDSSSIYEDDLVRLHPWFKPSDPYGNVVGSEKGIAKVSLPLLNAPDIAGYGYCVSVAESLGGTRCIAGDVTAELQGGFVHFTNLFIYRPGYKYRLRFEVNGIFRDTPPFNVLPSAPRLAGLSFDPAFTSLLMRFDSATNQANLGSQLSCEALLATESYKRLGEGSVCSWRDQRTLVVTLGNNVSLLAGSTIMFNETTVIHASRYWVPVGLSSGSTVNQPVLEDDVVSRSAPNVIKLTSPRMSVPACGEIQIPERATPQVLLRSQTFVETSVSAVEPFSIGPKNYLAIMNYCKGANCRFDPNVLFTTAKFDLKSFVYEWLPDGGFELVQELQTHGALDVEQFTLIDARKDGSSEPVQFLAIANHITLDKTPVPLSQCADSLKCAANVTIWAWDYDSKNPQFQFRQHLNNIAYATSVDVFTHAGKYYLAMTGAGGATSRTRVYRWVSGSYRLDELNGQAYGWPPGQQFGWVPGLFGEFLQQFESFNPLSCMFFHVQQDENMYLAIANYQDNNNNRVPVTIYRWDDNGCQDQGIVSGCFYYAMSLPASGASTLAPFSATINGVMHDMLLVGNFFEGDQARPVAQHYEHESQLFSLNFSASSFEYIQSIPTSGITSAHVFEHCTPFFCSTLLTIANQRGFRGLSATSRIYKWSDGSSSTPEEEPAPANSNASQCVGKRGGRFEIVFEMETTAAQDLMYVPPDPDAPATSSAAGPRLLYVSSAGRGTGVEVLSLDQIVPAPRPVFEYSPW